MSGVALKITKFYGEAPKVSPELLPETVAQYAFNLNLASGDLVPYRLPQVIQTLDKPGTIKTIYPLSNGAGGYAWLHWTTDVNVATAQIEGDTSQRIYYSGDGVPKVTNYALATSGTMFPTQSYILGMPLPTAVLTAVAIGFSEKSSTHRGRDPGGTAYVRSVGHGLRTGMYVTTTLFAGTGYNLVNAPVTVLDVDTFSYFTFGAAEGSYPDADSGVPAAAIADSTGRINLAGTVSPRTYVFTYYSQWGEESVPSDPSSPVYVKEGQVVTVNGLPTTWTHDAGYNTTGMKLRIYRTVAGVAATEYFRVGEIVLGSSSTFTDNIDITTLDSNTILTSLDYDPPEPTMDGMLTVHNGMIIGFFGNTLCFCEPNVPHAWPIKYRQQIDAPIIGIGAFGSTILVLTERTPWRVDGNNPGAITMQRTDYILPCLSKRSIVNIGFGVVWASTGGLAVFSSTIIGTDYLTKNVHSWDTWQTNVSPTLLKGTYYRGRYFGCDETNTFIFERNDQMGGHLIQTDVVFTAAHYLSVDDSFYYVKDGILKLWNSANSGPSTLDWKSKVFTLKDYVNLGAARVIADYEGTAAEEQALVLANEAIVIANQAIINAGTDLMGSLGGSEVNEHQVAGSNLQPQLASSYSAVFQLYANKQLVYTSTRYNDLPFRLPTGYRSDTYEVRVATTARIRAIHLAETMTGLRGA